MKIKYHTIVIFLLLLLTNTNATTSYCSTITPLGTFDSSSFSFAFTERVTLSKDLTKAFISDGGAGLQIVDITNPDNPILIGNYITNGIVKETVLSSSENKAFIADQHGGVKILDISNLANPILDSNLTTNGLVLDITISQDDSTIYIADYNGGVKIIDVSTPTQPIIIRELNNSVVGVAKSVTLSHDGNKLFASTFSTGVKIIDVSDKTNPQLINNYDTYYAQSLALSNDETKLFIADTNKGLKVLDISDPMNMTLISTLDVNGSAIDVSLSPDGSKAFVAVLDKGIKVVDINDTTNLFILNSFPTSQTRGITSSYNNLFFVSDGHHGLKILECSTPTPTPTPTPTLTPTLTPTPTPTQTPTPIPTATPPILDEAEADKVCLGDKVWNDLNQNGIQDQDESGIENVKVTLYANDCNTELNTTRTDEFGNYLFSNLEIGEYCVGFSNFSSEYKEYITTFKNEGQDDTKDSDVNRDTNKTDKFTLNAMENEECNISIDMGVYKKPVCGEIIAYDDIINANDSDQITQIDILNNDTGISEGQTIKFIPIIEGEDLWKSNTTIPDSVELLDTLTVKDEGVWSIENGIVKFVPYDSFNGKIPSPVYYTIISENCNATYASESTLSNVAQITIDTPCYCNKYESSIPIFNTLGIIIVIFLNSILVLFFTRKKVY